MRTSGDGHAVGHRSVNALIYPIADHERRLVGAVNHCYRYGRDGSLGAHQLLNGLLHSLLVDDVILSDPAAEAKPRRIHQHAHDLDLGIEIKLAIHWTAGC